MSKKFEDVSSSSAPDGFKEKMGHFGGKIKTFFLRNRKRNLKALLSIVICLVLVVAAMGGAYVRKMLNLINYDDGSLGDPEATFADSTEEEDLNYASMSDVKNAESIKELLKSWATNGGEKLYSKNVINVLLIGEDNDDGSSRSDTMILASVNRKTKTITLCSFLRDSYTYMNIKGSERYDKTNHSYVWGGASATMQTLSDNYKVTIDHYVSIDFKSFEKVIDLLGGVTVPITESEAKYMNRTTSVKGFEAGDNVKLNGRRALIYARIRKLDSEVERTRRQRSLIASVVHNIKASSISDLNKAVETFLPYVTTNYKSSEIISLGSQALSEGWFNYEIVGMVEPSENLRVGVNSYRTYTGNLFVWIIDYVKAAQEVQNALYGTTNIEIGADHVSALDMLYSSDDYNSSSRGNSNSSNSETSEIYEGESTSVYEDTTTRWSIFGRSDNNDTGETSSTSIVDRIKNFTSTSTTVYEDTTPSTESDTNQDYGYTEESTTSPYIQ